MTKEEFLKCLEDHPVLRGRVHFENGVSDGYYVLRNLNRWEVFFRERGVDDGCMGFPTEQDAWNYLLECLKKKK